jgi:hypothetical protein
LKNESIVGQQRQRIGRQFIQPRIAETKRRLRPARCLLLTEDVGDVVGAEGASSIGFGDGAGNCIRSILPDQFQQFVQLARKHTVAIGHATQIALGYVGDAEAVEKIEEASLSLGAAGRWTFFGQFPLEALGTKGLARRQLRA